MRHQRQRPDLPGCGTLTEPERDGPTLDEAAASREAEATRIAEDMADVLSGQCGLTWFMNQHLARNYAVHDGGFTFTSCGRLVTVSVTVSE